MRARSHRYRPEDSSRREGPQAHHAADNAHYERDAGGRELTSPSPLILSADWLIADPRTVIRDGQVRIEAGRVAGVGAELARGCPGADVQHFPGCALIPGLVDCHTHLELTAMRGVGRGLPFAEWIQTLTEECRGRPREFWEESARLGARECVAGGVTAVADYSTFGVSAGAIADTGMRGVVFHECFFPDSRGDLLEGLAALRRGVESLESVAGPDVEAGVSCHAPYNAAKEALKQVVRDFAGYRRSIHAAESPDEDRYIRDGKGPLADAHRQRGIPVEPHRLSPVEYLDNASYWRPGTLAVHLTQASQGDLAILKARGVSAVFCPSSNAALGVGIPRIALARRMGLLCGLGTDSAVSNERLDIFEEMRFALLTSRLRNDPLTSAGVFSMATCDGAAAAGIEGAGTLSPGGRADVAAVSLLREPADASPIERIVHQASSSDVRAVWIAGERVCGIA